jgi:hypothetical protein
MTGNFNFLIASPLDREQLVCEIYYGQELVAEISQENNRPCISIYPPQKEEWWTFGLSEFLKAVEDAKNHLLG